MTKGQATATRQRSHRFFHVDPHRIFYDVEKTEWGSCFMKQPPRRIKLRTMRSFTHHCTSYCCHATQFPFFVPQNKGYGTNAKQQN